MINVLKIGGPIKVGSLASDPASPENGLIYYNTTDNEYKQYKNSAWQVVVDDSLIGTLVVTPSNYTKTEATVSGHLQGIDSALAGAGTDEKLKVSANDTTAGYLEDKIVSANNLITVATINDGSDEDTQLTFNESNLGHLDGGASKHDATEIDYELADGSKVDIQAGSDTVEAAIKDLDDLKETASEKGSANGYCPLGADTKVSSTYLPSYVDDVLEYANEAAFPGTGETGKIYVALDNGKTFRWSGSAYVEISSGDVNSVFGRTGVVTATAGDYNTSLVTENTNLYYTQARFDAALTAKSTTNLSEGTNLYYTSTRFDTAFSGKSTSDLSEGTNEYFTAARAKAAAVADAINDSTTDVAPSQNAVFDALAGKLANVVEDTTPQLGGDLDVNGKAIEDASNDIVVAPNNLIKRAKQASKSSFIEEEYIHATSLSGSQTNTAITALTFAHATYEGCEIVFKVKEATSNDIELGTIRVVTNGTAISYNIVSTETASTGVTFDAAINGANVEIRYSSGSNSATLRCDVKRFLA